MIAFEDIDKRLKEIGKNRAWLAEVTGRSPDSIRVALAPNAPDYKRTKLLAKALSDAIEKEESAELKPAGELPLPDRLTIEVEPERMTRYCEAADFAHQNLKAWAIQELNKAADEWLALKNRQKLSSVAEEPPQSKVADGK
ncbi:MAG: hypothetical protein ABIT37_03840 [Luteolibacter sp.]